MITRYISAILLNALALLATLVVTGCAEEKFFFDDPASGDCVELMFRPTDMLPQYTDAATEQSRAMDPKTDEEREIRTIHLFFFDNDDKDENDNYRGNLLKPKEGTSNFHPYQVIGNGRNVVSVGTGAFEKMENVRVVAIVNIDATDDATHNYFCTEYTPEGAIRKDTYYHKNAEKFEIKCYNDLKEWTYHPRLRTDEGRSVSDLPAAGMPMIGEVVCDLTGGEGSKKQMEVQLRALMARVNISLKLTPDQTSTDGALPTMRVTSYDIKNLPKTVPFEAPDAKAANPKISDDANLNYNLTSGPMKDDEYPLPTPVIINKDSNPVTFSYYTYENIQLPNYKAENPGGGLFYSEGAGPGSTANYPEGVEGEGQQQRWKPLLARPEASALTIKGVYTTHQGVNYRAQFTIYLGANPVDDFMVERNHEYNNNITVHGLDYVRNSADDVYTFDARVNVTDDNPIYLAIVNERKIDAHATALPMDIWLLQQEAMADNPHSTANPCTVKLEIPEECQSWVSMALVPRSDMEGGMIPRGGTERFEAGTGVCPYFYTDMIDRCNHKEGTEPLKYILNGVEKPYSQSGHVIEFTSPIKGETMSRSRIYFYIDENVPKLLSSTDGNKIVGFDDKAYGDRICPVKLTYTDNVTGATYTRTIELEQRALVHVSGTHISGHVVYAWMEYYEEYLEHNDPLDKHVESQTLYSGLPWGFDGVAVRDIDIVSGRDGYNVYVANEAFSYTKAILSPSTASALSNLTLYAHPETAFHYCFGRNKRKPDGSVNLNVGTDGIEDGWYMPGIRELELALTQYYLDFEDFHGNLYLSAACGRQNEQEWRGWSRVYKELKDRARATKVIFEESGKVDYVKSIEDEEGSVPRTELHRVRAFYYDSKLYNDKTPLK